jgi:hypothetical protein
MQFNTEERKMKRMLLLLLAVFAVGCQTKAEVVSWNLSLEAGDFKITRRIVFYNGITDTYILTITGRCQIEHGDKLAVTCKTGDDSYKKHYLGLSDNVTYFSEQMEEKSVSGYRYQVNFRPESIVPDIDLKTSGRD